jgi:hypothetical protein
VEAAAKVMSMWDVIKNVISLLGAVLPILEKKIAILPVNPVIREEMMWISVMAAGIAGLGAYQSATRIPRLRFIGWLGLFLFTVIIAFLILLTQGHTLGLTPSDVSSAVRILYVLLFLFLGLAVGGFMGIR